MTTTTPPVNGQDIGIAAAATRALLEGVLAREGSDFPESVVLRMLSLRGGTSARQDLRDTLAAALAQHPDATDRLLERTAARGYVELDSVHIGLTEAGAARQRALSEAAVALTARLYEGFDPADLATAGLVLREVARRATALR
jgi:DNA-binding MarR family transcriptional regulator